MNGSDQSGIVWDTPSVRDLGANKNPQIDGQNSGASSDQQQVNGSSNYSREPASATRRSESPELPDDLAPEPEMVPRKDSAPSSAARGDMHTQQVTNQAEVAQNESKSGGGAPFTDAGTVMRYALDHLNRIFGEQWAEKAAVAERQLKRLDIKLQSLNKDLSTANQQVKERDKEIRRLRLNIQGMEQEKTALERKGKDLAGQLAQTCQERCRLEDHLHETALSARKQVLDLVEHTFGSNSELLKFVNELPGTKTEKLAYACVFSLPRASQEAGPEATATSIHATVTMANKFLENVKDFDGPERSVLLNIAADHLSRVSQLFTFRNEEGQLFNPDRHSVRSGQPSPGAKVTKITSFFVGNNRTKQPLHKAEVFL